MIARQFRLHQPQSSGFTIVELLVVIGVISVLVGILLPALSGVQRRAAKATEMNSIRQVHYAWMMYANNNNDAALPGYLERQVQAPPQPGVSRGWNVQYDYPTPPPGQTSRTVPPAPTYAPSDPNIAGPWVWRLLQYVDYNHQVVHGYVDEDDESIFGLVAEAEEVAHEPAFGYNGYYIGGWWEMVVFEGDRVQTPAFKFHGDCALPNETSSLPTRLTVPTTVANIRRSSEMVTFCSSSKFDTTGLYSKHPPHRVGSHIVTPPILRDDVRWEAEQTDPTGVVIVGTGDVYAPIGRYTGYAATLFADGHAEPQSVSALADQRKWINNANDRLFKHAACAP